MFSLVNAGVPLQNNYTIYFHFCIDFIELRLNSISYEIRATKTSAYQTVKFGPLSWDMNNSFAEMMLSMYKIYQPYHVFSFLYLLYDYLFIELRKSMKYYFKHKNIKEGEKWCSFNFR